MDTPEWSWGVAAGNGQHPYHTELAHPRTRARIFLLHHWSWGAREDTRGVSGEEAEEKDIGDKGPASPVLVIGLCFLDLPGLGLAWTISSYDDCGCICQCHDLLELAIPRS